MASREPDGSPIFDNIDIDMFVKVLAHTAFSAWCKGSVTSSMLIYYQVLSLCSLFPYFISSKEQNIQIPSLYHLPCTMLQFLSSVGRCLGCRHETVVNGITGFVKWYSRLYRNQGSLFFGPGRFDWGEQIVVVTGGTRIHSWYIRTVLQFQQERPALENFSPILSLSATLPLSS